MSPDDTLPSTPDVRQDHETPGCGLRVKFVSEINSNILPANEESDINNESESSQTTTKRKLPAWMVTSSDRCNDDSPKKPKSQKSSSTDNDNPDSNCLNETSCSNSSRGDSINLTQSTDVNHELAVVSDSTIHTSTNDVSGSKNLENVAFNSQPTSSKLPEIRKETDNEADTSQSQICNFADIKPLLKVKNEEATSTTRESCKHGIRCYRKNPQHRMAEAHPGDQDYRRPIYPSPPPGTPFCPFGNLCYRRNPVHFQEYSHPPETDFNVNFKNNLIKQSRSEQNIHFTDSESEDDPFLSSGDEDEDFEPSSDEEDEEDEEILFDKE